MDNYNIAAAWMYSVGSWGETETFGHKIPIAPPKTTKLSTVVTVGFIVMKIH